MFCIEAPNPKYLGQNVIWQQFSIMVIWLVMWIYIVFLGGGAGWFDMQNSTGDNIMLFYIIVISLCFLFLVIMHVWFSKRYKKVWDRKMWYAVGLHDMWLGMRFKALGIEIKEEEKLIHTIKRGGKSMYELLPYEDEDN